nr:MAG TPA: hypothetical protein [Herelleviridae sp.]
MYYYFHDCFLLIKKSPFCIFGNLRGLPRLPMPLYKTPTLCLLYFLTINQIFYLFNKRLFVV